jgi:hypothetical protein
MKLINFSIIFVFLNQQETFAYFDPGTGASIIQGIIAFASMLVLYFKNPKSLIIDLTAFLKKKFLKKNKKKDN